MIGAFLIYAAWFFGGLSFGLGIVFLKHLRHVGELP